jgi:hypothetical protein
MMRNMIEGKPRKLDDTTTNGDIDWVITNDPSIELTIEMVRGRNDVRWDVECFHRELKQLKGIEKCQCQSA